MNLCYFGLLNDPRAPVPWTPVTNFPALVCSQKEEESAVLPPFPQIVLGREPQETPSPEAVARTSLGDRPWLKPRSGKVRIAGSK